MHRRHSQCESIHINVTCMPYSLISHFTCLTPTVSLFRPIKQHRYSLYMPCQLRFSICHLSRVDLSELLTSQSHQTAQRRGSPMHGWPLNYSTYITLEECLWGIRFKEGDNVSPSNHSIHFLTQNMYVSERGLKREGGPLSFGTLILKISILVSWKKSNPII